MGERTVRRLVRAPFQSMFKLFSKKKNNDLQLKIPVIFAEREEGWRIYDSIDLDKTLQESGKKITSIFNNLRGFRDEDRSEYFDPIIHQFVDLVGNLPASENNHDARPFGLVDHCLSATLKAVCFHKEAMKSGGNTNPAQVRIDAYSVFCGTLCHDLGKIHDVVVYDGANERWNPVEIGLLSWLKEKNRSQFKFKYVENRFQKHEPISIYYLHKLVKREHLDEMGLDRVMDLIHYYSTGLDKAKSSFGKFIMRGDNEAARDALLQRDQLNHKKRDEDKALMEIQDEHERLRLIDEMEAKEKLLKAEREAKSKLEAERQASDLEKRKREEEESLAAKQSAELLEQKRRELEELEKQTRANSSAAQVGDDESSDSGLADLRPMSERLGVEPYIAPSHRSKDEPLDDFDNFVDVTEDESFPESESKEPQDDVPIAIQNESGQGAKDPLQEKREKLEEKRSLPTGVADVPKNLGDLFSSDESDFGDDFSDADETIDEDAIVGENARKRAKALEEGREFVAEEESSSVESEPSPEVSNETDDEDSDAAHKEQDESEPRSGNSGENPEDEFERLTEPEPKIQAKPAVETEPKSQAKPAVESEPQTSLLSSEKSEPSPESSKDGKKEHDTEVIHRAEKIPDDIDKSVDLKEVFAWAFADAYKNGRLQINEPKGNAWVGEDYTMIVFPRGIRAIYVEHHEAFLRCKNVKKFDKENDLALADAFRDADMCFRSLIPDFGANCWSALINPDGRTPYAKDLLVTFIKNEYCWKYVDVKPEMVSERFKVSIKTKSYMRNGEKPEVIQFGDVAFARRKSMFNERDWDAGKPIFVWNKKFVTKMIDWIIMYYEQCDPKTNLTGQCFFKNDDALFVAWPRIITLMAKHEPWNKYAFPQGFYSPNTVILNYLSEYRKIYLRGTETQLKVTIPEIKINRPLGVIGIQKRFIDEKAFNRYRSVEIDFINKKDWAEMKQARLESSKEEDLQNSMKADQ